MLALLREAARLGLAGLTAVALLAPAASAQSKKKPQAPARTPAAAPKPAGDHEPVLVEVKQVPTLPNTPVAIVNGEVITRQQLADEAIAMKGREVLNAIIARMVIEQAVKKAKMTVSEAEVYAEIDRIAANVAGVTREQWLRTLAKDRDINPAQYARDVIYPTIATRKLAERMVVLNDEDVKDAYESEFGEKLVYRMIMTRSLDHAKLVYEELKKNPAAFEKIARDDPRSIDQATRSTGGKPANGPLQRHSYPREVTDRIFEELVDGNADDPDPAHKPKDGDISGPIQVTADSWLIVLREGLYPPQPYDPKDLALKEQITASIKESKLQQAMEMVYNKILNEASVENRLTSSVHVPQQMVDGQQADEMIQRTENIEPIPTTGAASPKPADGTVAKPQEPAKMPPPPGVPASELERVERIKQSPK